MKVKEFTEKKEEKIMNNDKLRSLRRKTRIRKKLSSVKKHKLLVFRSSKHIYICITEQNDKTLALTHQ